MGAVLNENFEAGIQQRRELDAYEQLLAVIVMQRAIRSCFLRRAMAAQARKEAEQAAKTQLLEIVCAEYDVPIVR